MNNFHLRHGRVEWPKEYVPEALRARIASLLDRKEACPEAICFGEDEESRDLPEREICTIITPPVRGIDGHCYAVAIKKKDGSWSEPFIWEKGGSVQCFLKDLKEGLKMRRLRNLYRKACDNLPEVEEEAV